MLIIMVCSVKGQSRLFQLNCGNHFLVIAKCSGMVQHRPKAFLSDLGNWSWKNTAEKVDTCTTQLSSYRAAQNKCGNTVKKCNCVYSRVQQNMLPDTSNCIFSHRYRRSTTGFSALRSYRHNRLSTNELPECFTNGPNKLPRRLTCRMGPVSIGWPLMGP